MWVCLLDVGNQGMASGYQRFQKFGVAIVDIVRVSWTLRCSVSRTWEHWLSTIGLVRYIDLECRIYPPNTLARHPCADLF